MQFKEKLKPMDDLFAVFFVFSPVISGLLVAFGISYVVLFIPLMTFLIWTVYIYYYRAKYLFQDSKELAFLERVRGFSYFFGLVTTFLSSGLLFAYKDLTIQVIIGSIMIIALFTLDWLVPKIFFSQQTSFFRKDQKTKLGTITFKVNGVAMYFSFIVSALNITFTHYISMQSSIISTVLVLVAVLGFISPFAYLSFRQEKQSRKLSYELAVSLKQSKWIKKYASKSN